MNRIRTLFRDLHLWLGLTTGVVVFVVAVTGCCWVFQEEITSLLEDSREVDAEDGSFLLPTEARRIVEERLPGRHVHGVIYGGPSEALEVVFWEDDPEFYQSVFLNPYSGEVLTVVDHLAGFFAFVLEGHLHLWLPEAIGVQVVRWSTLVFVVLLMSGLYLWWPRNSNRRAQKFRFVWNPGTGWKRKTYDLHSIVGMYVSAVALVAAITGLVMAFDWFEKGIYSALGGDKVLQFAVPDSLSTRSDGSAPDAAPVRAARDVSRHVPPIDRLPDRLRKEYPQARTFELHYPTSEQESIYVEIVHREGVYYSSDYRFYDQYTLRELDAPSVYGIYEDADVPDMVIRMNYDTHVGAILGLPTKILMFFSSLIVASLPVTGFLFWWGQRRPSGRRSERDAARANRAVGIAHVAPRSMHVRREPARTPDAGGDHGHERRATVRESSKRRPHSSPS